MSIRKGNLALFAALCGLLACDKKEEVKKEASWQDSNYQKPKQPETKPAETPKPVTPTAPAPKVEEKQLEPKTDKKNEEYRNSIEAEIDGFEQKLALWREEAARAGEESKAKLNELIAGLDKKIEAANLKLDELKTATSSAWESTKIKVEAAIKDLKQGFQDAAANFKSEPKK